MIKDIGIGKVTNGHKTCHFIYNPWRWIVKKILIHRGYKPLNNISQPWIILNEKNKQFFSVSWDNFDLIKDILKC